MNGHDDLRPYISEEAPLDDYLMPVLFILIALVMLTIVVITPGVLT